MRNNRAVFFIRASLRAFLGCFFLGAAAVSCGFSFPGRYDDAAVETDHRSIGEYRRDVRTFIKNSKSEDAQVERNAVFNLCELHWELVQDPRFQTSQQIQGFRVVVARRLETYAKDDKKEQLRARRLAKQNKSRSASFGDSSNSIAESSGNVNLNEPSSKLDQAASSPVPAESEEDKAMYQSSADSYYSLGQLSGGPNQLFGYAGGHLGPPWDHGPELVDLIQNTINPDFWRANGGNGVIHYFRPLQVLVIGASTQVHEDTLDLLYKIRAAGQ